MYFLKHIFKQFSFCKKIVSVSRAAPGARLRCALGVKGLLKVIKRTNYIIKSLQYIF